MGRWKSLSDLVDPVIKFARVHNKKVSLPEFASNANGQRGQWLENAHNYLAGHKDIITAVFYFNHRPTNMSNSDCRWPLSTSAERYELKQMANDRNTFRPW